MMANFTLPLSLWISLMLTILSLHPCRTMSSSTTMLLLRHIVTLSWTLSGKSTQHSSQMPPASSNSMQSKWLLRKPKAKFWRNCKTKVTVKESHVSYLTNMSKSKIRNRKHKRKKVSRKKSNPRSSRREFQSRICSHKSCTQIPRTASQNTS